MDKSRDEMTLDELGDAISLEKKRLKQLEEQDESGWKEFDLWVRGKKSNVPLVQAHIHYYEQELKKRVSSSLMAFNPASEEADPPNSNFTPMSTQERGRSRGGDMSEKRERFLTEYGEFKQYAKDNQLVDSEQETVQLFAIYRNDNRSKFIPRKNMGKPYGSKKGNNGQMATPSQLQYLHDLMYRQGEALTKEQMEKLTKKDASDMIEKYTGGGS